jgi:hypothetical protein
MNLKPLSDTCDCDLINEVQYMLKELKYDVTLEEAENIWKKYSKSIGYSYYNPYWIGDALKPFEKWLKKQLDEQS